MSEPRKNELLIPEVLPAEGEGPASRSAALEGIVLDRDGNPVGGGPQASAGGAYVRVHTFRGGWVGPLLLIGIPLFLTVGLVIFGILAAVLIVFWLFRVLFLGPSQRTETMR